MANETRQREATVDGAVGAGSTIAARRPVTRGTLRWFWALAFGLGWGTAVVMMLFQERIEAIFGEIGYTNPVFILVVWSPGLAGIYLVWRHFGRAGLKSYFRRLTLWRMPPVWWGVLLLGIPAVKYMGAALNGTITDFPFSPWYGLLPALAATALIGPIEEFGWRGVALPLLQRRFAPFWASLILGAIWGFWHLPAFLLGSTEQSDWAFGPFVIGVLSIAIILTPMFNAARGSIAIAALYHFQLNGPAWPDAQPWENYLFAALAVAVVVFYRKQMFSRDGAVQEVLMPERKGRTAEIAINGSGRPSSGRVTGRRIDMQEASR
jgi:membrane protease YdiL (CAAX protease family)